MCCSDSKCNIQFFAKSGQATISVPNPNLNGTGSLGSIFTVSGGVAGGIVRTISIKAIANTSQGMIRLFISDGVNVFLYKEVRVPALVQGNVFPAFGFSTTSRLCLSPGYSLLASTETPDSFNVIVNGVEWVNCDC